MHAEYPVSLVLCCRQATDLGFPHAWWQLGHRARWHFFYRICMSSTTSLLQRVASDFLRIRFDIEAAPQKCPEMGQY
jgi:hypothetical protein